MENNIESFLSKVGELNNKFEVVKISAGKNITCSHLTFKQQKNLLASAMEGFVGLIKFQKILNDILLENTGEEDLLITDKLPIILKLRSESISPVVKVDDQEVKLDKLIQKSVNMKFIYQKDIKIKGVLDIDLKVPSIKEEQKVLKYATEQVKKNNDEVSTNIGNIYTYEILKYIDTVKFGENVLTFRDMPIKDCVTVVENLPLTINKQIISFIEEIKKVESNVLKVAVGGKDHSIDIDVTFFDN